MGAPTFVGNWVQSCPVFL